MRTNPYGIKTPKTVEEFRHNLKKYYVTIPHQYPKNEIKDFLYLIRTPKHYVNVEEIKDLVDVYRITGTGFGGDGSSPSICPRITTTKELTDWMRDTNQVFNSNGYFYFEDNFKLWECSGDENTRKKKHMDFWDNGNPQFYTLDNQWLREFYWITLGEFSGYIFENVV